MVIEEETGFHFRRRGDRLVLAMHDPKPRWTFEAAVDESVFADRLERLARRYPPAAGTRVERAWAGLYDMTPDAHPIVGPVADGVYAACGFSGHGFMQSPAVGRAVAEEILRGEASLDLGPYRLERFEAGSGVPRAPSCSSPPRPGEHRSDRDDGEVAREQEPGPGRRVVEREPPVGAGEPRLRQAEREQEQRRAGEPAPAADERDERHEPDQELRREHLPEGDERGDAPRPTRGATASPSGRRRRANAIQIATTSTASTTVDAAATAAAVEPESALRAVARHGLDVGTAQVAGREEHGRAEALDLERSAELPGQAVAEAVRREHGEGEEAGGGDGDEGRPPGEGGGAAAAPPEVCEPDRREHERPELRRERGAGERAGRERLPAEDERERGRGEQRGPEVEAGVEERAEHER